MTYHNIIGAYAVRRQRSVARTSQNFQVRNGLNISTGETNQTTVGKFLCDGANLSCATPGALLVAQPVATDSADCSRQCPGHKLLRLPIGHTMRPDAVA